MTGDIDEFLTALEGSLEEVLRRVLEGETVAIDQVREEGPVRITTNVTISGLPEALRARQPRPSVVHEPLVEAVEEKGGVRVTVSLPGVKREDVTAEFEGGALDITIKNKGRVHTRRIPLPRAPAELMVRSVVENNSVVEMRFVRRHLPRHE